MKACNAIIQTPRPHRPRHREGRGLGTHALKAVTSRAALPLKGKPRKNRILAEPRASAVVLKVHGLWERIPSLVSVTVLSWTHD